MQQINTRLDEKTRSFLAGLGGGRPNSGAGVALQALPGLYRRTLGEMAGMFSLPELSFLVDVANRLTVVPAVAGQQIAEAVANFTLTEGLDKKWGVDGTGLAAKLGGLTIMQRAVLEWELDRYWSEGAEEPPAERFRGIIRY